MRERSIASYLQATRATGSPSIIIMRVCMGEKKFVWETKLTSNKLNEKGKSDQ